MDKLEIIHNFERIQNKTDGVIDPKLTAEMHESIVALYDLKTIEKNVMPRFFDEWVKSTLVVCNVMLGKTPDNKFDWTNQTILMRIFLDEFKDPKNFKVTSQTDIKMMDYLTVKPFNTISNIRSLKCIDSIINGYEVAKDD